MAITRHNKANQNKTKGFDSKIKAKTPQKPKVNIGS